MEQPSDDTPSVSPSGCQLPQGGSRERLRGLVPFNRVLAKTGGWRAIFIAPTKLKSFLHFTTHRGTLPQSRVRSTAPSEREPGNVPIHRAARKPGGFGRFSSPLRSSKVFTFHHSTKSKNHSSKSEKMGVEFLGRVWYNNRGKRCRISSLVEWSLPKPQRRVRFPYPAPQKALASAGAFLIRKIRFFVEFSEFFGIIMEIPPPMEDMLWMR